MQSGPERRRRRAQALARDRTLQSLVADLVAARTDAGMSQAEVAARMFTTTSAVSRPGIATRRAARSSRGRCMSWTAGFSLKPQPNNDRGTAILVAASIHDACHYLRLFRNTSFGRRCGIVTSYEPNHNATSRAARRRSSTRTRRSAASSRSRRT